MFAATKDKWRRTRWFFATDHRFRGWSFVALGAFVFTLVTFLAGITLLGVLGLLVEVLALWQWVDDWRARAREADALRLVPVKVHHMSSRYDSVASAPYADWSVMGDRGRGGFDAKHAIYQPDLDRRLQSDAFINVELADEWVASDRVETVAARWGGRKNILNEEKIRLSTDLLPTTSTVVLQRTDYNHYMVTNHLALAEIRDERNATLLKFSDVGRTGRGISTLADSRCSNHLGGDLLVIGPGRFWLQVQSMANRMFPGHWAASGGSFDWDKDVDLDRGLLDLVKSGLLRELNEEFALEPHDSPGREDVKVIGYARTTFTGGKPQFYGVARVKDMRPKIREEYVEIIEEFSFERGGGASALLARIETFQREARLVAPPLKLLFRTLRRFLDETPDAEAWLTEYW